MAKKRETRTAQHRRLLNEYRPIYPALLKYQGGGCATCGRPPSETRRLDLDHDHKMMVVRGLLCVRCNRALPDWLTSDLLRTMADYLDNPPLPAMVAHKSKPTYLNHDGGTA
jgi:hypothetical protein